MAVAFVKEVRRDRANGWRRIDWDVAIVFV